MKSLQCILVGAIFFLLTQVIAVLGYRIAGWSWMDAISMVVITVFGWWMQGKNLW